MKSTFRLALAAAVAQDIAGFTDLALDLDDDDDNDDDDDKEAGDDALLVAFLVATDVEVGLLMDVFEVFKADATVVAVMLVDEVDDVQCTGGFGKAVGAGAS